METAENRAPSAFAPDRPMFRREQTFADGAISYLEWPGAQGGGKSAPLVFAHANGFNALTYRELIAPLAGPCHIWAWDARGHGATTLPADPAQHSDWYVYRDDLIRFVEARVEQVGRPVYLAGHSMGGMSGIMAASERPDLVSGLFLIEPVMLIGWRALRLKMARRLGMSAKFDLATMADKRKAVWPNRETMVEVYQDRGIFRSWPRAMVADYVEGGTRDGKDGKVELACAPAWEAANFRAQDHNARAAVRKLTTPFTLLYGGNNSTTGDAGAALLAARDPGATVMRIGSASHFLPMEYPQTVRRELIALIERIDGGLSAF